MKLRWALIDIKVSGANIIHDNINDITVFIITETGLERIWQFSTEHLFAAETSDTSTKNHVFFKNIRSESVVSDKFETIADSLKELLKDSVMVAYNARLTYAFLKNAYKRLGIPFQPPLLCFIKLIKKLYPQLEHNDLPYLATKYDMVLPVAFESFDKLIFIHSIIKREIDRLSLSTFLQKAQLCYRNASVPSKLTTEIASIPNTPGVYLFFSGTSKVPLYIGKSVKLKQRILSHFQTDYTCSKEFAMSQQVERIEYISTAGELSALLLESILIKKHVPIYNRLLRRKKQIVGFRLQLKDDYLNIECTREVTSTENISSLYGSFRSITAAKKSLLDRVKKFKLCSKLCALDHSKSACFAYQIKQCNGACIGKENPILYNKRVQMAMEDLIETAWPYKGMLVIKEYCEITQLTQYMIFYQWRYLGAVSDIAELAAFKDFNAQQDLDSYKILASYMKNKLLPDNAFEY